jgi:hypothetical protein
VIFPRYTSLRIAHCLNLLLTVSCLLRTSACLDSASQLLDHALLVVIWDTSHVLELHQHIHHQLQPALLLPALIAVHFKRSLCHSKFRARRDHWSKQDHHWQWSLQLRTEVQILICTCEYGGFSLGKESESQCHLLKQGSHSIDHLWIDSYK